MSIQDRFGAAVRSEAQVDEERRTQAAANGSADSHLDFFSKKKAKRGIRSTPLEESSNTSKLIIAAREGEGVDTKSLVNIARNTKQNMRRGEMLKEFVLDSIVNRVQNPSGNVTMEVTLDEWQEMHRQYQEARAVGRQDELEFVPFSVYGQNLIFMSDGVTPRKQPLREQIKNEVGQFVTGRHAPKIIVLKGDSPNDDGKLRAQVPGSLVGENPELVKFDEMPYSPEKEAEIQRAAKEDGLDAIDDVLSAVQKEIC